MGAQFDEGLPETAGRHAHHQHVGLPHDPGEIRRRPQVRVECEPLEVAGVLVVLVDGVGDVLATTVEDGRLVVRAQMGDRRPPRTGSDHGDVHAHALTLDVAPGMHGP